MLVRFLTLAALAALCSGCPEERQPQPGYPPPGYPQPGYGRAQPGMPPGQGPMQPPGPQPQPYPQHGYAMPTGAPGAGAPTATQPGMPAPSNGAVSEPIPPLAPFGPPDPGGAAAAIHIAHMQRAMPALDQLAARHMINMLPEGEPFAAQFNEGQIFEQEVEIEPGRCYGLVAVAMGIKELDLVFVLGEPPVDHVLGRDALKGWQAVVGPSGKCIQNTLPTPEKAKVQIKAVTGAGTAVAQLYSK